MAGLLSGLEAGDMLVKDDAHKSQRNGECEGIAKELGAQEFDAPSGGCNGRPN